MGNKKVIFSVFLILVFLFCQARSQKQYLTGTIRDFSKFFITDFDIDADVQEKGLIFIEEQLDREGKPTFIPSVPGVQSVKIDQWFEEKVTVGESVVPFTAVMEQISPNKFAFESGTDWFPIDFLDKEGFQHNRYFTLEMGAYITYNGGEVFNFNSSDDFWLFINNEVSFHDLSGIHPFEGYTLQLDSLLQNKVAKGSEVFVKIFYAHRSRRHNPHLYFELSSISRCNVASAGVRIKNLYPFTSGVDGGNSFILGQTTIDSGNLTLLHGNEIYSSGAAWHSERLSLLHGFVFKFQFQIVKSSSTAEGFAWVIQNVDAQQRGSGGSALGYGGLFKSIAIEFDTNKNSGSVNDPDDNHISIHSLFQSANTHFETASLGQASTSILPSQLDDGNFHLCEIQYFPPKNGYPGQLTVNLDGIVVLPSIALNENLMTSTFPDGFSFFGFTSASTNNVADIKIKNWLGWTVERSGPRSTIFPTIPSNVPASISANPANSFVVTQRDGCGSVIPVGGAKIELILQYLNGTVVKDSSEYTDFNNGSYLVSFYYSKIGDYTFSILLDEQHIEGSPFTFTIVGGDVDPKTSSFVQVSNLQNLVAGVTFSIGIIAMDSFGNPIADSVVPEFGFSFSNSPSELQFSKLRFENIFQISLSTEKVGSDLSLFARIKGIDVGNSPINGVIVKHGPANAANCTSSGTGLQQATAGEISNIQVFIFDKFKNKVLDTNVIVSMEITKPSGSKITPNPSGIYNSNCECFLISYVTTEKGSHPYKITVNDEIMKISSSGFFSYPSTLNPSKSTLSLERQLYAGRRSYLTIETRDTFGNRLDNPTPGDGFSIEVYSSLITPVNVSCSTSSSNSVDGFCQYSNGGEYIFRWTPTVQSFGYKLTSFFNEAFIVNETQDASAIAGPINGTQCYLNTVNSITAGVDGWFVLDSKDSFGNERGKDHNAVCCEYDDSAVWDIVIQYVSSSSIIWATVKNIVKIQGAGKFGHEYNVSWTGTKSGSYSVDVLVYGSRTQNSLQTVSITPGPTTAQNCLIYGPGSKGGVGGVETYLFIQTRDNWNNNQTLTDEVAKLEVTINSLTAGVTITPLSLGIYNVSYTTPAFGGTGTTFIIQSKYDSAVISTITATVAQDATKSGATAEFQDGVQETSAGIIRSFTIIDRDENGLLLSIAGKSFSVDFIGPDILSFQAQQSVSNDSEFIVDYTLYVSGTYTITLNSFQVVTSSNQYSLLAKPGLLNPGKSIVFGLPAIIKAGNSYNYSLLAKDSWGNSHDSSVGCVAEQFTFTFSEANAPTPYQHCWGNGTYSLQLYPTKITTTLYMSTNYDGTPLGNGDGALSHPAGGYGVTVTSGSAHHSYSSIFVNSFGRVGEVSEFEIEVRDMFNNPVSSSDSSLFSILLEQNEGLTSTTYRSKGNGIFSVSMVPQNTSGTRSGLNLTFYVGGNYASSTLWSIDSSDAFASNSLVQGIAGKSFSVGDELKLNVTLKDSFFNLWTGNSDEISVTVSGAGGLINNEIDNPLDYGFIFANTPGILQFRFRLAAASISLLDYNVSISVRGIPMDIPGLESFTVNAGPTDPFKTSVPPLNPSTLFANETFLITFTTYDTFGNRRTEGGDTVGLLFINDGGVPDCPQDGGINNNKVVNYVIWNYEDFNNGSYAAYFRTTVAGSFGFVLIINGEEIYFCTNYPRFVVQHLEPHAANCAVENVVNTKVGVPASFKITLKDKFNNPVISGNYNLSVGNTTANVPCPENSHHWLSVKNDVSIMVANNHDSTLTVTYNTTVKGLYSVVVTVQDAFIGTTCPVTLVKASYIYYFEVSSFSSLGRAAVPENYLITGFDQFGNEVEDTTYSFNIINQRIGKSHPNEDTIIQSYLFNSKTSPLTPSLSSIFADSSWSGNYSVSIKLIDEVNQNKKKGKIEELLHYVAEPATCSAFENGSQFRCPNGKCVASYDECDQITICAANENLCYDGVCREKCDCMAESTNCENFCIKGSNKVCPSITKQVKCPKNNAHYCENSTVCRKSAADCPSRIVCAPGTLLCPDKRLCAYSIENCLKVSCDNGLIECPDGKCVLRIEDCASKITCKNESEVLCQDNSCASSPLNCPSQHKCYEPNTLRCPDGSCRKNVRDCPTHISCPEGTVMCEDETCVDSISKCQNGVNKCSLKEIKCPDGTCMPNFDLCPTYSTCHVSQPVKCPDGSCSVSSDTCFGNNICPNNRYKCPDGSCISSDSTLSITCPTISICPKLFPVKCSDGSCVSSTLECQESLKCPSFMKFRCPDGSCKSNSNDCPNAHPCPKERPVKCDNGNCVVSYHYCPQKATSCEIGFKKCPGGTCARQLAFCPTTVTCPPPSFRCFDGSCRTSCSSVKSFNIDRCDLISLNTCPRVGGGETCRRDISDCPQEHICPLEYPVRCPDRSCKSSVEDCPIPQDAIDEATKNKVPCPGGGWASGYSSCGTLVTCPASHPFKCYDESCKKSPSDCPAPYFCPKEKPFLCWDGDCYKSEHDCSGSVPCSSSDLTVKCPWFKSRGGCVASSSQCLDVTDLSLQIPYKCSNYMTRCRDGSCKSDQRLCQELECPPFIPFRCKSGKCVKEEIECDLENGCPYNFPLKCWNGKCTDSLSNCPEFKNCTSLSRTFRCPDGSCLSNSDECNEENSCPKNYVRCHDGTCAFLSETVNSCTNPITENNACPVERPYKCEFGFCAISSIYCPIRTSRQCKMNNLNGTLCDDGSCVETTSQCPIVQPCRFHRCGDGICRADETECPEVNTCIGSEVRCQNGLCASSLDACPSDTSGCPSNTFKCQQSGKCVRFLQDCQQVALPLSGCPSSRPIRCPNMECAVNRFECRLPNGCFRDTPYKCQNGDCVVKVSECPALKNCSDFTCPMGECPDKIEKCLTPKGLCPSSTPVRCFDGSCKKYHATELYSGALLSNSSICPTMIGCHSLAPFVCSDGSCVSHQSECKAFFECPQGFSLCPDMINCVQSLNTCGNAKCPGNSPSHCSDGACMKSFVQCNQFKSQCSEDEVLCSDGTCRISYTECIKWTHRVKNNISGVLSELILNNVCEEGKILCSNGKCSNSIDLCEFIQKCPETNPYLCSNGKCVNGSDNCDTTTCLFYKCEDGTCRNSESECQPTSGCPLSAPLYCPRNVYFSSSDCVVDESKCFNNSNRDNRPLPCIKNCIRDVKHSLRSLTVVSTRDTKVDITVDDRRNLPISKMFIPAWSLGRERLSYVFSVKSVDHKKLHLSKHRIHPEKRASYGSDEFLVYGETVLSSPIQCISPSNKDFEYSLIYESKIDIDRADPSGFFKNDENVLQYEDICLGYLENNEWKCLHVSRADRILNPVWKEGKYEKDWVFGSIPRCSKENGERITYAFIFAPLAPPEEIKIYKPSYWERNKTVIIVILASSFVFFLFLGYFGWRLYRYKLKAKKQQKELKELQERADEIEETGMGLGVYGEGTEMIANPMVVELTSRETEENLLKERKKMQEIERENYKMEAEMQRVKNEINLQQKRTQEEMMFPGPMGSGGLGRQNTPQPVRQEFGPVRMKKKGLK